MNFITTIERFTHSGLKFKVYSLNCAEHPSEEKNKFLPIYMMEEILEDLTSNEPKSKYHIQAVTLLQIYQELKTSKFIGHSCIMIIVNMNCDCRSRVLYKLWITIKHNRYLKYKPKIFLASYHLKEKKKRPTDFLRVNERFWKFFNKFPISNKLYPKANNVNLFIRSTMFNCEIHAMNMSLEDYRRYYWSNLDNSIFIQYFTRINLLAGEDINNLLNRIFEDHKMPVQSIFIDLLKERHAFDLRLISTSTNADLYFYSINPALAIIINNYYFPQQIRTGSDIDFINLIRALKISGIPYVPIEDCSKEKLLEIIKYLENKDFYPLKNFIFIMMSHGDSNNVIYTYDGQLDIHNDIVKPILANGSLKNVVKIFAYNACRGLIHMAYADDDDLEMIKPTKCPHLDDNTVLVYSVPDQVKSLRSITKGSPFPRSFSSQLKHLSNTDTVDEVFAQVNEDIKPYYDHEKCVEIVRKNPKKSFNILPLPHTAIDMIKLINSIECDLKEILESDFIQEADKTQYYICGFRQKEIQEVNPCFYRYFLPELDNDQCVIVAESELDDISLCSDSDSE